MSFIELILLYPSRPESIPIFMCLNVLLIIAMCIKGKIEVIAKHVNLFFIITIKQQTDIDNDIIDNIRIIALYRKY